MARPHWISKKRTRSDIFKESAQFYIQEGFRNKLEKSGAKQLTEAGVYWEYEKELIPFVVPERISKYKPDFVIGTDKKIYLEFKGWPFEADDRQKMILVRDQHPEKDIRIVFSSCDQKIYGGSKTTVGEWASEHNFKWAGGGIVPEEWLEEIR